MSDRHHRRCDNRTDQHASVDFGISVNVQADVAVGCWAPPSCRPQPRPCEPAPIPHCEPPPQQNCGVRTNYWDKGGMSNAYGTQTWDRGHVTNGYDTTNWNNGTFANGYESDSWNRGNSANPYATSSWDKGSVARPGDTQTWDNGTKTNTVANPWGA